MSLKSIFRDRIPYSKWKRLARIKYGVYSYMLTLKYSLFGEKVNNVYDIPIFINNYNRLDYLKQLIASLERYGISNIHIIDNNSTYPPLLDFYKKCKYDVIFLGENVGYLAFWKTDLFKRYGNSYYILTDPDLVIDDMCPSDLLERMFFLLKKYPTCNKVGMGLRIDNLPDHYKFKKDVIEHESKFWSNEIEPGIYDAPVDTTFAMYKPYCGGPSSDGKFSIRLGFPYVLQHLPWYIDTDNLSEEERFYMGEKLIETHWTKAVKDSTSK